MMKSKLDDDPEGDELEMDDDMNENEVIYEIHLDEDGDTGC